MGPRKRIELIKNNFSIFLSFRRTLIKKKSFIFFEAIIPYKCFSRYEPPIFAIFPCGLELFDSIDRTMSKNFIPENSRWIKMTLIHIVALRGSPFSLVLLFVNITLIARGIKCVQSPRGFGLFYYSNKPTFLGTQKTKFSEDKKNISNRERNLVSRRGFLRVNI